MSLASSLPRTSRQSAPMPGLRSGMNRGRRLDSKNLNTATFPYEVVPHGLLVTIFVFSECLPRQHLSCDAPHNAEQLECRTKNYLLQNLLCKCETDFRYPLERNKHGKTIWRCLSEQKWFWTWPGRLPPRLSGASRTRLGSRVGTKIRKLILVFHAGPPRTRIAFAEKCAHGLLISAGVLAGCCIGFSWFCILLMCLFLGPMWILAHINDYKARD